MDIIETGTPEVNITYSKLQKGAPSAYLIFP